MIFVLRKQPQWHPCHKWWRRRNHRKFHEKKMYLIHKIIVINVIRKQSGFWTCLYCYLESYLGLYWQIFALREFFKYVFSIYSLFRSNQDQKMQNKYGLFFPRIDKFPNKLFSLFRRQCFSFNIARKIKSIWNVFINSDSFNNLSIIIKATTNRTVKD